MVVGVMLLAVVGVVVGCGGGSSRSAALPGQTGSAVRPASAQSAEVLPANGQQYLGDMDLDGKASVGDAIKILRMVVGLDSPNPIADANQSGTTDVGDAIKVLRCVVGLDPWPIVGGEAAAIRQLYQDFAVAFNAHDVDALSDLISDSYLHEGEPKNDFVGNIEEFFTEEPTGQLSFTIQQIQVQDSYATVTVIIEFTSSQGTETFTEPAPPGEGNPLGVAWLVKEGDSWFVYGDQGWYEVLAFSVYWPDGGTYSAELYVFDPADRLISASVSGPGIAGSLSLSLWQQGEWLANAGFGSTPPPAPNEYTFTLVDADGTTTMTATIEDYFPHAAVNMRPNHETVSAANLVFTWNECPGTVDYGVELYRGGFPGERVWDTYDHSMPGIAYSGQPLQPGAYSWLARMENANGNISLTQADFTVGP